MNMSVETNVSSMAMGAASHFDEPKIDKSAAKTAFGVMIVAGFLGGSNNIFLTGVIIQNKKLRTGGGVLIAHLLLTYGLICMLQYPMYCIMLYGKYVLNWTPDPRICNYLTFLHQVPLSAAPWADVCLTANRLIAILIPHKYRVFTTKLMVSGTIIFSWAMGFVTTVPGLFNFGFAFGLGRDGTCSTRMTGTLFVFWISLGTWIPYAVISLGYLILWIGIAKSKCSRRTSAQPHRNAMLPPISGPSARRMRVTKTLTALFVWNAICFVPTPFIAKYATANAMMRVWQRIVPLIGYGSSPFIFYLTNKDFRDAVSKACKKSTSTQQQAGAQIRQ